ncbi:MAG: hypothetical protein RIQ93_2580 [Verrucomicrobiota bacterium]|jgi:nucleotide-binding universal stress UspA family protein
MSLAQQGDWAVLTVARVFGGKQEVRINGQAVRSNAAARKVWWAPARWQPPSCHPMKTVLAAIDFSPICEPVIDQALSLARALNARVVLLHAVDLSAEFPAVPPAFQLEAARDGLLRIQKDLARRGSTVETVCLPGAPVARVLSHATQTRAEYIVLGSHGHSALYDLVVGSTASAVLKQASCRVVIVPARFSRNGHAVVNGRHGVAD